MDWIFSGDGDRLQSWSRRAAALYPMTSQSRSMLDRVGIFIYAAVDAGLLARRLDGRYQMRYFADPFAVLHKRLDTLARMRRDVRIDDHAVALQDQ